MIADKLTAEYTYDHDLDVVNIEINEKYNHEKTIELSFGIFLDFDENFLPVNLEILSASEIFGVEKERLHNPDGNVNIIVGHDIVEVEVTFQFSHENQSIHLNALNELKFPNSKTTFDLV